MKALDTYTVYFFNSDTSKQFPNKQAAHDAAVAYCGGNNRYAKPFPQEDTRLYGPGDGTASCMIRRDFDFTGEG